MLCGNHGQQVYLHLLSPESWGITGSGSYFHAGIVKQQIYFPPGAVNGVLELLEIFITGNVASDQQRFNLQFAGQLLERLSVPVKKTKLHALSCQLPCRRSANTSRRAGYYGNVTCTDDFIVHDFSRQ